MQHAFFSIYKSFESSWLAFIPHPYSTVCDSPHIPCVGVCGVLSVTLHILSQWNYKKVMCEAGEQEASSLLALLSCLQCIWSHESVLTTSDLTLSCSMEEGEDNRVSKVPTIRPLSYWEFPRDLGVKSLLHAGLVKWGRGRTGHWEYREFSPRWQWTSGTEFGRSSFPGWFLGWIYAKTWQRKSRLGFKVGLLN